MQKKLLTFLQLLGLTAVLLVGCGPKNVEEAKISVAETIESEVESENVIEETPEEVKEETEEELEEVEEKLEVESNNEIQEEETTEVTEETTEVTEETTEVTEETTEVTEETTEVTENTPLEENLIEENSEVTVDNIDETQEETKDTQEETKDTQETKTDAEDKVVEIPQPIITEVEKYTVYATCGLNLREGPGTQYNRVSSINTAGEMSVIAKADNGWIKVVYRDKEYFCSEKYTSTEKPVVTAHVNNNSSAKAASNGVPGAADLPAELMNSPYHNVFKPEGSGTNSVCVQANNYWNYTVPDGLKTKLVNNGWKFVISGQRLADRFGYGMSIAGITDYGAKTIYLDNRSKVVKRATLHEIGHAVDAIHGWPSNSGEFAQIFEAEKYSFVDCTAVGDGHETSNVQEYFASVFQNAIINAGNCQRQAPRSYEFVMRYMG